MAEWSIAPVLKTGDPQGSVSSNLTASASEADSPLIELGVAAQAEAIVTRNLRDVARGELKFPSLRVLTPEQCMEVFPCRH